MPELKRGYSYYELEGDGVTTVFPLQFVLGYLTFDHIYCRVNDEELAGVPVYRSLTPVPGDPGLVTVGGTIPALGEKVAFRRIVPKDALYHAFSNGSILNYPTLDEEFLSVIMALHEVMDGFSLGDVFVQEAVPLAVQAAEDAIDAAALAEYYASTFEVTKAAVEAVLTGQIDSHYHVISYPVATAEIAGIVELETVAETLAGVETTKASTAAGVKATVDAAIAALPTDPTLTTPGTAPFLQYMNAVTYTPASPGVFPGYAGINAMIEVVDGVSISFRMMTRGEATFAFKMKRALSSGTAKARLYKNNVLLQEWTQTSESYQDKQMTIQFQIGDIITLMGYGNTGATQYLSYTTTDDFQMLITQPE